MARVQKDIMIADDFDVLIKDGNLVFGDATRNHIQLITFFQKGEVKASPLLGVGIENWLLDDEDALGLQVEMQAQYEADGATVKSIDLQRGIVKAEYE